MPILNVKPAGSCKYDLLALGEVMLRLDPGEGRVRTARQFKAWEGGGEYNVARGLRRGFRPQKGLCPAFFCNEGGVGRGHRLNPRTSQNTIAASALKKKKTRMI